MCIRDRILVVTFAVASLAGVLSAGWKPILGVQLQGGVEVVLRPTAEVSDEQLERAIEIIRNRVDAIGVAEPDITRQGSQVVIQLPGVKDKQRAVDLIGQTAELRFRPVIDLFDSTDPIQLAAVKQFVKPDEPTVPDIPVSLSDVLTSRQEDEAWATVVLLGADRQRGFVLASAALTGEVIEEAAATFQGQWILSLIHI